MIKTKLKHLRSKKYSTNTPKVSTNAYLQSGKYISTIIFKES